MPNVQRVQFQQTIAAAPATVWRTMLDQQTYGQWTAPFGEGSRYEGSWEPGGRIHFVSASGDGMVAEVAESRPHEFLSIRHVGFVMKGVEDTQSEAVRAWAPAYENYTFEAVPEGTRVVVDQDVTGEFQEFLNDVWPKALGVLKQLCEGGHAD